MTIDDEIEYDLAILKRAAEIIKEEKKKYKTQIPEREAALEEIEELKKRRLRRKIAPEPKLFYEGGDWF
jgi:chaperonin cofactor prefoldin